MEIRRITEIPQTDLQPLLEESMLQGYNFLEWLVKDFESGKNRFEQPGEALFGVYEGGQLIAVGGLNRDPHIENGRTGRVRRVYILKDWRRKGVGRLLMDAIIHEARQHFTLLTLRTPSEAASKFYIALGFGTEPELEGATHHMQLN